MGSAACRTGGVRPQATSFDARREAGLAKATYILMHRNVQTVVFSYDLDAHAVEKVLAVPDAEHAPLTVFGRTGTVTAFALNRWWHERGLLASCHQLRALEGCPESRSTLTLAERSWCLSLSDCYWVDDEAAPLDWDAVNFFDNDFSHDLNLVPVLHSAPRSSTLLARTTTLMPHDVPGDVEQRKKWVISGGERMFIKAGGSPFNQAAYNEVIATRLYRRLLQEDEYVPYALYRDELGTYCASATMLGKDEELIPVYDLIRCKRRPDGLGRAAYLGARLRSTGALGTLSTPQRELALVVSRLQERGLGNVEDFLSKMFTCDYLLANDDRHFCNFGAIRDAATLRFKRIAPIYDTGMCLWCRAEKLETFSDFHYATKPFRPKGMRPSDQLALFDRYDWFDESALEGFADEAKAILDRNPLMPPGRSKLVHLGIERNIECLANRVRRLRG